MLLQAPAEVFRNWDEEETCIIVTATNVGRRPVTVTGFHFKLVNTTKRAVILFDPKDPRSRYFDAMPKELHEGQMARAFIPIKDMVLNEIEYAYVVDTAGRQWKSNPFRLPCRERAMTMKLHVFRLGAAPLATLLTGVVGGVRASACIGEVADAFRTSRYGEVVHPPPPEARASDAEFKGFLRRARPAGSGEFAAMLAGAAA